MQFIFSLLLLLLYFFLDDTTRTKFLFYAGNDYQGSGGLTSYIPEEYVPDFLGGTCKVIIIIIVF